MNFRIISSSPPKKFYWHIMIYIMLNFYNNLNRLTSLYQLFLSKSIVCLVTHSWLDQTTIFNFPWHLKRFIWCLKKITCSLLFLTFTVFLQAVSALVQPLGVCAEYLNSSVVQVRWGHFIFTFRRLSKAYKQ